MSTDKFIYIDNRKVRIENEKNLLEVIRKAHIDLPTFCYHSELSVYGACRLCLCEVEGKGYVATCSEPAMNGMKVRTNTEELREIRRTTLELLLANHDMKCPTCDRSDNCKLRALASKMGVETVPYRQTKEIRGLDSSDCLVRDPNKCVLCGDCVRFCHEVQGIGALEFTNRGEGVVVSPAFGKSLAKVDCVNCGQCAAVCPTGAIVPKTSTDAVFKAIYDKKKTVVVQVAPAVRVALGEAFGMKSGVNMTGKMVAAWKILGFEFVFDTSFAADLTVIEEANEYLKRKKSGEKLPIFTSCCPAWVKFAEQSFPDLLGNLSTCRSPQQMFGSLAKKDLPEKLNIALEDLVVVSVMPCTAKKFEAKRPEFNTEGYQDVDYVLTTQELARMIKEAGIRFADLSSESMDLPMGFATGAGVIFGQSGGVSEAVLRYAVKLHTGKEAQAIDLEDVRGNDKIRRKQINLDGIIINMAMVYGLSEAKALAKRVLAGEEDLDIIEVMACPQGCIGGAGQPIIENSTTRESRSYGISEVDKNLPLHNPLENPYVLKLYDGKYEAPNCHKAHHDLHTHYHSRKRIQEDDISLIPGTSKTQLPVRVCVGTSCYLKGSQDLLGKLMHEIQEQGLGENIDLKATFCTENCSHGPTVVIGNQVIHHANYEQVCKLMLNETAKRLGEE